MPRATQWSTGAITLFLRSPDSSWRESRAPFQSLRNQVTEGWGSSTRLQGLCVTVFLCQYLRPKQLEWSLKQSRKERRGIPSGLSVPGVPAQRNAVCLGRSWAESPEDHRPCGPVLALWWYVGNRDQSTFPGASSWRLKTVSKKKY